jgi:hypothetical protein
MGEPANQLERAGILLEDQLATEEGRDGPVAAAHPPASSFRSLRSGKRT